MVERSNTIEGIRYTIKDEPSYPEIETRPDGLTHFHFPKEPRQLHYEGRQGYLYIPEPLTRQLLDQLSLRVPLHDADNIIVFQKGAEWTFHQLALRHRISPDDSRIRRVITRRANGGDSVEILNPEVLEGISPHDVTIGIEDMVDRDGTGGAVLEYVPSMHLYAPIAKRDIHVDIPDYVTVVATIDPDKWIGGIGSDYGPSAEALYGYESDYPRASADILVMPESLNNSAVS
jgi:hypothetical protein